MSMAAEISAHRSPSRTLYDPLPGTGYRALRRIGGGSTSEVFEATGPSIPRCAVKVLRSVFVDTPDAVFRLEQEARALAALYHPGVAPVLDAGTTATGRPYFVMPRLTGETVKDRLARLGPMTPAEACGIMVEVLEALDAAHRAGVVHRDVKPGNVFLCRGAGAGAQRALLLDFGVAKILAWPGRFTTDARIVGTPRYLAPEQILGGLVDGRTDVYAAGLTLFEMIAGRSPFDGDGLLEPMRAHLEDAPLRLRSQARVPDELDHAVARALAKPPAHRWPTAGVFASVLDRVQASEAPARRSARRVAS